MVSHFWKLVFDPGSIKINKKYHQCTAWSSLQPLSKSSLVATLTHSIKQRGVTVHNPRIGSKWYVIRSRYLILHQCQTTPIFSRPYARHKISARMLIQVKVYLFLEMNVHTLSNENIFHWSLSVSIFEVVDYDQTQDLPESRFYGMKVYLVEFCYISATICILGNWSFQWVSI